MRIAEVLAVARRCHKKALLVEDSDDDAILAEIAMMKADITVERVSTAEEALQRVKDNEYDMVILDVKLNGSQMTGIDCAIVIKQLRPDLPCLISTGSKFMVDEQMAGMVIIPKPLSLESLRKVAEKLNI